MATRQKTIVRAFPIKTTLPNNSLENFTQITLHIPESGVTFKSVLVKVMTDDKTTATPASTLTTKRVDLQLGSAGYETQSNTGNRAVGGVRNMSDVMARNFTSYFVTNWTGTSMTCDIAILMNQTAGTTLGMVNCVAMLYITYDYDDTSAKQLNTVAIPVPIGQGYLPTSKTSHGTIPALDTYLEESGKVYRDTFFQFISCTNTKTTTAHTVSFELGSLGVTTTEPYENALSTTRLVEYTWKPTFDTSTTHDLNIWASQADRHSGMQGILWVTYEWDLATTTKATNSAILPIELLAPIGTSTSDYQRGIKDFIIQEPNPVAKRIGAYLYHEVGLTNWTTFFARLNGGSWINPPYEDLSFCGSSRTAMMLDTSSTFTRGKNTITLDMYTSTTSQSATNPSAFIIVNYSSDIAIGGRGTHNQTVFNILKVFPNGSQGAVSIHSGSAKVLDLPNTDYFINGLSVWHEFSGNSTNNNTGVNIVAERLSSEPGGLAYLGVYSDFASQKGIPGTHKNYALARDLFNRWHDDVDTNRLPLNATRTFRTFMTTNAQITASSWHYLLVSVVTTHSIRSTWSGNIINSNGGLMTIDLHRTATGEKLLTTTRTGNGAYSFEWNRDDELLYAVAYEDGTYKGRSDNQYAVLN